MSTYNHKKTAQLAHDLSEQLISHGIDVWLEYGSALGAVRDGGIAKGDSDIDLAIWWKDWKRFKNIMVTERIRTNIPFVYNFRTFPEGEVLKVKVADPSTELNVDKEGYVDTIYIDVYGMQEYNSIRYSAINFGLGYRSKLYYQKNLKQIKFEGFDFYVSKYIEKYLDYIYKGAGGEGTTWRVPVDRSAVKNWEKDLWANQNLDSVTGFVEGVFDIFHKGHVRLLKRMKDIFSKVYAAVTPDHIVSTYKNPPIIPFEDRVEILESCKYVDKVYFGLFE